MSETNTLPESVTPPVNGLGMRLREYQLQCVSECETAWVGGIKRLLAVLATGLGKTVIFSEQARRVVAKGGRVLILAHTDELLIQAADKLEQVSGLIAAREKAQDRASLHDPVVIASIQTLSRGPRLSSWAQDHFELVIVDECHRAMAKSYENILNHFHPARVLGVTATADRGDERNLGKVFEKCVFDYGLLQGVRDGWLVRPIAQTVPVKVDMRGIKTKRGIGGNDLDAEEIARRLDPFLEEIAGKLIEHAGKRKTLLFLPSVDTAAMLAAKLHARGVTADFVSGDRERCPDRHSRIERYREGETQFMANAMLLTEGFDDCGISCVSVLRPTKMRGLFTQCCGRGTRPLAGVLDGLETGEERRAAIAASAKPDLLILDFLWLTERLDLIHPAHLVTAKIEVAEKMANKQGDLLEIEAQAERDLLKSLASEASKHKKKKARVFDPLAKAITLGEESLQNYRPIMSWEASPVTMEQRAILEKHGVDVAKVTCAGLAAKWIGIIDERAQRGLCSLKQLHLLEQLGIRDAPYWTRGEAGVRISKLMKRNR